MKFFKKLFFISLFNLTYYTNTFQINVIPVDKTEEKMWQKLKDLFVVAFCQAFKRVEIKDINSNFNSTSEYLKDLFDADRKNVNNLKCEFIIASEKQEIIGYILSCFCSEEKTIYIHHLVVDASKYNKGVGKGLIKACEDLYKEADLISLFTRKYNDNAIGFYKHIGFHEKDSVPKIAYIIRPTAKNNSHFLNLEKKISKNK